MDFAQLNDQMKTLDAEAGKRALDKWNNVGKPIGSLGALEDAIIQIAALTGSEDVSLKKKAVLAFCADNGVVAEGVTQTGQEVTAIVSANMGKKVSSVCRMASVTGADVFPVDVGIASDQAYEGVLDRKIAQGTANMTQGPAMTPEQCLQAIQTGIDLVRELKEEGYSIIATGEMGIGNTTTSSAVASVLLGQSPAKMTGKGAGLSDEGLARKVDAIERAIAVNDPDPSDAFDVVAKVGGFDLAGMVGAYLGGALYRVPIIIDGFISAVAALAAVRLCPNCASAILASHVSAEAAGQAILDALQVRPLIYAGMRLGEGTGAVCLMPLLDMALTVYDGMSFEAIGVDAYEVDLVD